MNEIEGKIIVDGNFPKEMSYEKISNVEDYEGSRCIITDSLNPDIFLIFGKIDCIISKRGSKLSHLAILAREYGKSIIIANCSETKSKGQVFIEKNNDTVTIKT